MAGKPGWWNANEQVSGEQAWKPVHKLGDFSVGRGGGGGGALSYGLGALAGAAIGKKLGGKAAAKTPVAPAKQIAAGTGGGTIGNTAVVTPELQAAMTPRNDAFNAGAGFNLTDVRSASSAGTSVDTWAGGRYNAMATGLNAGVTPTPARLQPFRSGIGAGAVPEPETAELVSMPNSGVSGPPSPGQNVWSHGTWNTPERSDELSQNAWMRSRELHQEPAKQPLMLNPGPQRKQRIKPGIQPMGKSRIDRDLAQYRA